MRVSIPALVAVLVLVGLVTAAPTAVAAESSIEVIASSTEPIKPGNSIRVPVRLEYSYSGQGTTDGTVDVSLSVMVDSPAQATMDPTSTTIQVDDQQQEGSKTVHVVVAMDEDADAFELADIRITARAESSGTVSSSTGTRTIVATADYVPGLHLEAEDSEVTVGSGISTFRIRALNEANGVLQVRLDVMVQPDGIRVARPPPKTVSHGPGSTSAAFDVRLLKGPSGTVEGDLTMRATYWLFGHDETLAESDAVTVQVKKALNLVGTVLPVVAVGAVLGSGATYWFWWRKR